MPGIIYDKNGKPIIPTGSVASSEQFTVDSQGNIITPALEEGNIRRIAEDLEGIILTELQNRSSETTLSSLNSKFGTTSKGIKVDGSAVVHPVSVDRLPLPDGAATEVTLSSINNKLSTTTNGLKVDGSNTIQPVSVSSLPLPLGAAKDDTLKNGTQKTQIVDVNGNSITSTNNALDINIKSGDIDIALNANEDSVLVNGYDGTNVKPIKTDVSGRLDVNISSSVLPNGAATENTLSSINSKIPSQPAREDGNLAIIKDKTSNLDVLLSTRASEVTLASINSKLSSTSNGLKVDGSGVIQPVQVMSTILPTGAATSYNQETTNQLLIDIKSEIATELTLSEINSKIEQTPSGIKVNVASIPAINIANIPLPPNAATASNQINGSQKTQIVDSLGNVVGVTNNALDVNIKSGVTLDVGLSSSNDSVQIYGSDGSNVKPIKTDNFGNLIVNVANFPNDYALSSKQDTTNYVLNDIDNKIATEVTLSNINNKITTTANGIKVDGSSVVQPVSVSTLPLPEGAATSAKQDTTNYLLTNINDKLSSSSSGLKVDIQNLPLNITGSVNAIQSGAWDIRNITGTISLPTGAATESKQDTTIYVLNDVNNKIGEVQNAPTQYTVLGRLADIKNQLITQVRGLFAADGTPLTYETFDTAISLNVNTIPFSVILTRKEKMFLASYSGINMGNAGSFNPILYINNPANSGKIVYFHSIQIDVLTVGQSANYNFVLNPTVTANGTAINIVNSSLGSSTTSAINIFRNPTITAGTGTQFANLSAGTNATSVAWKTDCVISLLPGNWIVITANPSQNNNTCAFTLQWAEI